MKRTSLADFRRELLETGSYETKTTCLPAVRAPKSALTTLRLGWNVVRVFPWCAVFEPLGKLSPESWARLCFSSVTGAESLGIHVNLSGWQNRTSYDGPVVYLANHMSTFETILLPPVVLSFGSMSFVAKDSLGHLPFLGKAAAHMGMITLGRQSPREDLMHIFEVGTERIKAGQSVLIYPQGTRRDVFDRAKFSSIGAKLAERAGCPICPIAVDTRCLPTRKGQKGLLARFLGDFGTVDTTRDVKCACGPLIPVGKSREMHEATFNWIADTLDSWGLPTAR